MPIKRTTRKPKSNVKIAKLSGKKFTPNLSVRLASRAIDTTGMWRSTFDYTGESGEYSGLQVWIPVDPYTQQQRLMFRASMGNPYVWRANRIITNWACGQGYTTKIVPREEEEMPKQQLDKWTKETKFQIPYFNKEMTCEEIVDYIDRLALDLDLAEHIRNAYFSSREQGRGVLAMGPIDKDEYGRWQIPTEIRLIRPEFTLRPYLDMDTGEFVGVQIVGIRSTQQFILPAERCIYLTNDFNQTLFSDYYGVSQVERIIDPANVLNIIFAEDFVRAAEHTWHQPKVFQVDVPPQNFGQESAILDQFLQRNNNAQGQDIAVTQNVELLNPTTNSGDINGLEIIVRRCIKSILAYYNLPGFMLSEGDIGKLGGNANTAEIDMFLNSEVNPEKIKIEKQIEGQFYDSILCILFAVEDPKGLPVKIKHTYNKPHIATLFRPDLYYVGVDMLERGLIDQDGLVKLLGMEPYVKDTMSEGEQANPSEDSSWFHKDNGWGLGNNRPINVNLWPPTRPKMWRSNFNQDWPIQYDQWQQPQQPQTPPPEAPSFGGNKPKKPAGSLEPTEDDVKDPTSKLNWAKIQTAKEIVQVLKDG